MMILSVIEAYCFSARQRQTMNCKSVQTRLVFVLSRRKIIVEIAVCKQRQTRTVDICKFNNDCDGKCFLTIYAKYQNFDF